MNEPQEVQAEPVEVELIDVGSMGALVKAEIDQQVTTAKAYRRSITEFKSNALSWATLDEETAEECTYAIPRAGKVIEGPTARFAEIIAVAWGNCRAGARVIEIGDKMVRCQGFFMDVQANVAISYETSRRITDKYGRRLSDDMIAVTANANSSIAYRTAILKGIPQALWKPIWKRARLAAAGTADTLVERRGKALEYLKGMKVTEAQVFETLGVKGIEDMTLEHLATLKALINSIREGDLTVDAAFGTKPVAAPVTATSGMDAIRQAVGDKPEAGAAPPSAIETPPEIGRARRGAKGVVDGRTPEGTS